MPSTLAYDLDAHVASILSSSMTTKTHPHIHPPILLLAAQKLHPRLPHPITAHGLDLERNIHFLFLSFFNSSPVKPEASCRINYIIKSNPVQGTNTCVSASKTLFMITSIIKHYFKLTLQPNMKHLRFSFIHIHTMWGTKQPQGGASGKQSWRLVWQCSQRFRCKRTAS